MYGLVLSYSVEFEMMAVNYSTYGADMKTYMDAASDDHENVVVSRKGEGRNVVIISEDTFNNLIENAYIRADYLNYSWLIESKKQLEEGKVREVKEV
mgnify:FL=1